MDVHTFTIGFSGDLGTLFKQATTVIREAGGSLMVDDANGCFSVPTPRGTIQGDFDVDVGANTIQIALTKLPPLVSGDDVEQVLGRLLREGLPDDGIASFATSMTLPADAQQLVPGIAEAVEDAGGLFAGDSSRGVYAVPTPMGMVEGGYAIAGRRATLQIDRCPALLGRRALTQGVADKLNMLAQDAPEAEASFAAAARPKCCTLNIEFTGTAEARLAQAKSAIGGLGGSLSGDTIRGNYTIPSPLGKIVGRYIVNGQTLTALIDKKPLFVGCGRIESELRKALG